MQGMPLPGTGRVEVAVPAPGTVPRVWAGAPSAALDDAGGVVLAYRRRIAARDLAVRVVATSPDGVRFTTVAEPDKDRFGASSMERPALARTADGRWRLYVCSTTRVEPRRHWWAHVLEAAEPAALGDAEARTVWAGDQHLAVKDPVVRRAPTVGGRGCAATRSTSRTRRTA